MVSGGENEVQENRNMPDMRKAEERLSDVSIRFGIRYVQQRSNQLFENPRKYVVQSSICFLST